jgi:integrase
MARQLNKLSALAVARAKARGYLADGGGLYLQITPNGSKSWVFRFREGAKLREMGLGPTHTLTLGEARDAALICRKQRLAGLDPIAARQEARATARLEAAKALTFQQCAEAYIETHKAGWHNSKHAAQWGSTLKAYAYPILGNLPVAAIDTGLVLMALEAIWNTKPETASRLRQRIESILDWARVRGYRAGDNPARWKGHLDHSLPARGKVAKVKHHAALPYANIGPFMNKLRGQPGTSALALEFAILTAARTGEVLGVTWAEIDLSAAVWIVPASRMKAGREHRIPLSDASLAVLREAAKRQPPKAPAAAVFPGAKSGKPLSSMALLMTLRRMDRGDLTAHGFRSTFRDWAAEQTNYPGEVAEAALAHTPGDKVEAAYRRGDLFDKRRQLMDAWATYCSSPRSITAQVVPVRSLAASA